MKNTLQSLLSKCLEETKRSDSGADLSTYPSQILCLCEEITFTQQCESSITNNRLKNLKSSLKVYHKNTISTELNKNICRLDWMA
jgi:dynein heavy chain 2, cytosolic